MRKSAALYLAFAGLASAAGFPLGVDSTVGIPGSGVTSAAVDAAGFVYLLQTETSGLLQPTAVLDSSATTPSSYVTKLSPDGSRTVYVTMLGFAASAMAVDPAGYVYVVSENFVEKLDVSGASVVYRFPVTASCILSSLAVDSAGHAFVTGVTMAALAATPNAFQQTGPAIQYLRSFVAKVNTAGTGFDYATYLSDSNIDQPSAIALGSSGDAYIAGMSLPYPQFFLVRLSADGSSLVYSTLIFDQSTVALAVASEGSAVVYQNGNDTGTYPATLRRFNPQGTEVEFSTTLLGSFGGPGTVAVDAAGNTYVTGFTTAANFPVKDNLAPCQSYSTFLTVFDPSGNLLQSTYVPGVTPAVDALALGPGGVYLAGLAGSGNGVSLVRLSRSKAPRTVRLACLGNAGTNLAGPVAAGEIVSLFGESMSPLHPGLPGVPVSVTFDGAPAPLLYADANQVNAVVPWELDAATTTVCESYAGAPPGCMTLDVAPAVPGVFMADDTYALAVNQDGTINAAANPAPPGSIVSIFATGLGPVTPVPQDGAIAMPPVGTNVLPVEIVIPTGAAMHSGESNMFAPQYAGPAPFQLYGLSQINLVANFGWMYLHAESPGSNAGAAGRVVIASPVPMVAAGSSQSFQIHVAPQ